MWVLQYIVVWEQCVAHQREEARFNANFVLKKDPVFTATPKAADDRLTVVY